jgi:hypothetical protein
VIVSIFSCNDRWEVTTVNKFLLKSVIDTSEYKSYEELIANGKIREILKENTLPGFTYFDLPIVSKDGFVFIEKKVGFPKDKNMIIKIDKNGEIVDSIIISRNFTVLNDYIIDKEHYCTWLVDNDKEMKKMENINYFAASDETKVMSLIKKLNNSNKLYYSTFRGSDNFRLDTCNYIITFKGNKPVKHNYLKEIRLDYQLQKKNLMLQTFSTKLNYIHSIKPDSLFKVDNFFANYYQKLTRRGTSANDLFSNTGTNFTYCNSYSGTFFLSLFGNSNLKLKLNNAKVCESRSLNEIPQRNDGYTESFLNFYIINRHGTTYATPVYYLLPK